MSPFDRLSAGLRRRTLWQVLGLYAAGAWVALQVVDILANNFSLPGSFPAVALALLILGLPMVVATYYVQRRVERTLPQGVSEPTAGGEPARPAEAAVRRWFTWRNALAVGVVAFAAWGVVAAAWFIAQGAAPGGGARSAAGDPIPTSPSVVAVFPFAVQGSPDFEYLGGGMVNLLGTKLDGAGELRSVDSRALLSAVEGSGTGVGDPSRAAALARDFGAGLFVLGDLVEVGGKFRISAALYRSAGTEAPVASASVEGNDAFALVDEIATALLAGVEGGPGARVRRIAAVTTPSLEAYRAYLSGESAFRAARFADALEAFQQAVEIDSLFAMAYYRLSVAAEWLTRPDIEVSAAEQAYLHSTRLSERDRRMLEAFLAWRRGAHGEAEQRYRAIVGTYPTDVEAWFQLGEVYFHANPLHGRSIAESREPFERVLSFEPNDAVSIIHLVRLEAMERNLVAMDSLLDRLFTLSPTGDRTYEMRALEVFAHDAPARQDSLLRELTRSSDQSVLQAVWNIANFVRDPEGTLRAAEVLTDRTRFAPEVWTTGNAAAAFALLSMGRVSEALARIDSIAAYDEASAAEYGALVALTPFMRLEREELRSLRAAVEAIDAARIPDSQNPSFFFNAPDGLHGPIRAYLAGALSARLGEAPVALRYAAELDSMTVPAKAGSLAPDLAASVRAQVALTDGRTGDALASLENVRTEILYSWTMSSPYAGAVIERYLRGQVLQDLGRYEEALGWYAHLGQIGMFDLAFVPAAHLRQAEIYEALDRPSDAARHYAAFIEQWRNADPDLQPLVDDAREALRRLMPDAAES